MSNVTVVVNPPGTVVVTPTESSVVTVRVPGPQGPPGLSGAAGSGVVHTQSEPLATWTIPHSLGRPPSVDVFADTGELVFADVVSSSSTVTVTFAAPVSGFAILT